MGQLGHISKLFAIAGFICLTGHICVRHEVAHFNISRCPVSKDVRTRDSTPGTLWWRACAGLLYRCEAHQTRSEPKGKPTP
jgi:hypothetical protein